MPCEVTQPDVVHKWPLVKAANRHTATALKALGEPRRVAILHLLRGGPRTVGEDRGAGGRHAASGLPGTTRRPPFRPRRHGAARPFHKLSRIGELVALPIDFGPAATTVFHLVVAKRIVDVPRIRAFVEVLVSKLESPTRR